MKILLRNFICILGLIVLTPLIIFTSILILFEDGFPIIFKQTRVGINKENFMIFKLRTMKKDAPSIGTHEVEKKFYLLSGKVIRKFKIDELPQLLNVIKGDLNLIGFRPGLINQDELNSSREKYGIFNNKPGITGLAQVTGFNMSEPDNLSKVDKIYYDRKSFVIDFQILVCTFTGFFRSKLLHLANKLDDV